MFGYTESSTRVIYFARQEAIQLGAEQVEAHHILLALMRESKKIVLTFLPPGTSKETLRRQIGIHAEQARILPAGTSLPLHKESKRILEYASEEAEFLEDRFIGPGHLLLGVLREENSVAAKILHGHGVTLTIVRDKMKTERTI